METIGFEPTTPCLQSRCSSQLSYVPVGRTRVGEPGLPAALGARAGGRFDGPLGHGLRPLGARGGTRNHNHRGHNGGYRWGTQPGRFVTAPRMIPTLGESASRGRDLMDRRDELLKKSWEGEVLGRSFFAALCDVMPEDRPMWGLLTELESTMETLVAPVAEKHGIEVDRAALEEAGSGAALTAPEAGREPLFKETLGVVAKYLTLYEELTDILPDDEAWIGRELIAHEQALAYYIAKELAGEPGGEAKVAEFLSRHGADIPAGA